jgi:hypothetical protein
MNDIHYLTPEGKRKLEEELNQLKTEERDELAARLKQAISMGDLSENADYQRVTLRKPTTLWAGKKPTPGMVKSPMSPPSGKP